MGTIFFKEIKLNLKQLLIWSITVGGLGLSCILLYQSMQGDMKDMADMFSEMGAFSDAFGMSTLSIATLKGYFATEVGTVHGLGSGMFAAVGAVCIIAKEEEKHTGEFLLSLPISRAKVIAAKGLCVVAMLVIFTVICAILYVFGFAFLKEDIPVSELITFMGMQLLMNLEIASVCFFISSLTGKINMGLGLGISMVFYVYDLIGRVVPDMKDYLFLGPYSYANASEIFSGDDVLLKGIVVSFVVIFVFITSAFLCYERRDLAS